MGKVNHGVRHRFYTSITLSWKLPRLGATASLSPVNPEFGQVVNRAGNQGGKGQRESRLGEVPTKEKVEHPA